MVFRSSFGSKCHNLGEFSSGMGLHTNGIEGFWAILKRSIIGSYHHVSTKYSQQYVNKCCFRQNNRFVDSFNKLLWQSVLVAWNYRVKSKRVIIFKLKKRGWIMKINEIENKYVVKVCTKKSSVCTHLWKHTRHYSVISKKQVVFFKRWLVIHYKAWLENLSFRWFAR